MKNKRMKFVYILITLIVLFIVGYKGYNYIIKNWYSDTVITVRLVEEEGDCDFEDALFKIDSVYKPQEERVLHVIVLPIFSTESKDSYSTIYKMDRGIPLWEQDSSIVIIAKGTISKFPNLESWYGCKDAYTFMIHEMIKVQRVVRRE